MELGPEDTAQYIKPLLELDRPVEVRLVTISYIQKLAQVHPRTRPDFVRNLASLLLITEEPLIAQRIVQALLALRVKEAAEYIHIAFQERKLPANFLGGWEQVQTTLAQAAPAEPVDLPSFQGDQNQAWEKLLFGKVISPPASTSPKPLPGSHRKRHGR